jgi:hypothetical protein
MGEEGPQAVNTALNGICPYFTMFPLSSPRRILMRYAVPGDTVLDPFAGRGTTLYAARLQGMRAYGIDSNAVAVAISEAKLTNTTPTRIVTAAKGILRNVKCPIRVPAGEFWELAFDQTVLRKLCRLREGLIDDSRSDARKALRAVILGALHGPMGKSIQSYFSNQCPRTYAPKPRYAVGFWKTRRLLPPKMGVMDVIKRRADRYFSEQEGPACGRVVFGDSQQEQSFDGVEAASWIITSPPYYGMRTYLPDQWLRNWFVGGSDQVDYSNDGQLLHSSKDDFCKGLKKVWQNCAKVSKPGCRMVIRFGAINDRDIDARTMIRESLTGTQWKIVTCHHAGSASAGRRQADHFAPASDAILEYDVWTVNE